MTTISGSVLDAGGRPVASARVFIAAAPAPVADVAILTGADGRFVLGAARAGSYRIVCSTDDFGSASVTVEVGTQPVVATLRLGGR